MVRFVFWNLNRRGLARSVAYLARQENADVVILAESGLATAELQWELNAESPDYQFAPGNCAHLVFFTRFHYRLMRARMESHRVSIRCLELPGRQTILIGRVAHPFRANSKLGVPHPSRPLLARGWAQRCDQHHGTTRNPSPILPSCLGA